MVQSIPAKWTPPTYPYVRGRHHTFRPVLLSIFCVLTLAGCAELIVREDDNPLVTGGKVVARIVLGVSTLGGSELAMEDIKNADANRPMADGFHRTLLLRGTTVVVWGYDLSAVSTVVTLLQQWGVRVVERAAVDRVFAEQRFRLTYSPDREADLLKVGHMLGADQVVFVNVQSSRSDFRSRYTQLHVTIRGVDVGTGELSWTGHAFYPYGVTNAQVGTIYLSRAALARAFCPPGQWSHERWCAPRR